MLKMEGFPMQQARSSRIMSPLHLEYHHTNDGQTFHEDSHMMPHCFTAAPPPPPSVVPTLPLPVNPYSFEAQSNLMPVVPELQSTYSTLVPVEQSPVQYPIPDQWGEPSMPCVQIDPEVLGSQDASQSTHIGIPNSEVYPGPCGFKVQLPPAKYNSSTNTLLLKPEEGFSAILQFESSSPPKGTLIRALVCCKDPEDVIKLGPCRRCSKHPSEDTSKPSSSHFLLCNNTRAMYGVHLCHKIVTVPVEALFPGNDGLVCVYKCVCHSTCMVGRSRNKATLILIFSLIHKGVEIGRDVVNINCCANPNRVVARNKKAAQALLKQDPSSFPKLPRGRDLYDNDPDLDEDGYYNFTWRGKTRIVFDLLSMIKEGYTNGPRKE